MQLCSAGEEKSEKEVACSFDNSKVCSNRPLKRPLLDNIRRGTQGTYWESEAGRGVRAGGSVPCRKIEWGWMAHKLGSTLGKRNILRNWPGAH